MSLSKKRIRKLINYSKENRIKRVKRYVKKYKIDLRTELGEDCLRMASIYGSYAIVKYLLKKKVCVRSLDEDGNAIIHLACAYLNQNINKYSYVYEDLILPLLKAWPECLDIVGSDTRTPRQILQSLQRKRTHSSSNASQNESNADSADSYVSVKRKTREDTSSEGHDDERSWRDKLNMEREHEQDEFQREDNYYSEYDTIKQDENWADWASRIQKEYAHKKQQQCGGMRTPAAAAKPTKAEKPAPTTTDGKQEKLHAEREQMRLRHEAYVKQAGKALTLKRSATYAAHCDEVFDRKDNKEEEAESQRLRYSDIPWPAGGSLNESALHRFFSEPPSMLASRSILKRERIRWHPDRFKHRTSDRLADADLEKILEHVNALSQTINNMISLL